MPHRSASLATAALVSLVVGCSKPQGETATAPSTSAPVQPPAFDVEGFCEQVMALPDGRKCNIDDEVREQNKVGYCATLLRKLRGSGRVSFDRKAAKACIAAVEAGTPPLPDSRTVQDLGVRVPACRKVAVGRQAAGAPCESSVECSAGHACVRGSCAATAREGQPCSTLQEVSLAGLTSSCSADLDCIEGKCSPRPRAHAAATGAPCRGDRACAAGRYCADGDKRTCQPRKAAGERCSSSRECKGRCSKADGACVDYCSSG